MKRLYNALFTLFFLAFTHWVSGQYIFVENGKQWPETVQYSSAIPGGRFYIEDGHFTFNMYDASTVDAVFAAHSRSSSPSIPPPEALSCHAYKVHFAGASTQSGPFGKKVTPGTYNYFLGNDPSRWSSGHKAYEEVIYPELYSGIDLKVYSKGSLKYDFIVKPGGRPGDIVLRYEGIKPRLNKNGEVELKTAFSTITESKPFAYQYINGELRVVGCAYILEENELKFAVGTYDVSHELIIDPELIFSTFSGSIADNFGYTATYDIQGNLYGGSSVFGNGYPVTTGAFQSTWAGGTGAGNLTGTDIAVSKFNSTGTELVYSTYLGGNSDEVPNSLVTDSLGTLYILSTTGSLNFPVTAGAFQTTFQGGTALLLGGLGISLPNGSDIAVSRLNTTGTELIGSTFVGGSGNDGTNTFAALKFNYADEVRGEIDLDTQGNVLIGSTTFSDNFPMITGAYQAVKNATQEGVLFKLSSDMTQLLASTFFGGSGGDAIYSIDVSPSGKILAGGGTTSANLNMPANAYEPTYVGGAAEGFLIQLDADLQILESGTYFGSMGYDQIYFAEYDKAGRPHAYGQTTATGNTLIFNAPYSVPNSGMFLAKFQTDMQSLLWSTVFGSGTNVPNLSPTAFSVDICNRIYLAGWGGAVNSQGNTNGLPVTPDALKPTTNGSDFYLMVLEGDASGITYASFFGGDTSPEHVDGGTSRFDRGGKVYQAVCAGCGGSSDFPIAPANAVSPTNNSTNCNLGVAKIDFDLPLALALFTTESICLPDPAVFSNLSNTFSGGLPSYTWLFGDGTSSSEISPTHQYTNPGIYTVQLIMTDPLSCNLADTFTTSIQVYPEIFLVVDETFISCDSPEFEIIALTGNGATLYTWADNAQLLNPILQGPTDSILTFTASTQTLLYIEVTNGLCTKNATMLVVPPPTLQLSTGDTLICTTGELTVNAVFGGGSIINNIQWTPTDLIISGQGSESITIQANAPLILGISAISEYGCEIEETVQVDVYPIFLETSDDVLACANEEITLTASSSGVAQTYIWADNPGLNNPLNAPEDSIITVIPNTLTWYYIQVENNGCILRDSVAVSLFSVGTTIRPDQFICSGDTALIFVLNDFPGSVLTHQWSPEEFIISGQGTSLITAIVTEATTFTALSSTPDGCTVENSSTVFTSELGNEIVEAVANPAQILIGNSSEISVVPANSEWFYEWEPATWLNNAFSPMAISTPPQDVTYTIVVTDVSPDGFCEKRASVTIKVFESICGEPNIFVANAFTPNADGENDDVRVFGGGISTMDFKIFNRWGELVFETTDQARGWDGTYKGKMSEPAVFVYHLQVRCGDGQDYFTKGNITLIR
jgi:gliding motility-associated-like protein